MVSFFLQHRQYSNTYLASKLLRKLLGLGKCKMESLKSDHEEQNTRGGICHFADVATEAGLNFNENSIFPIRFSPFVSFCTVSSKHRKKCNNLFSFFSGGDASGRRRFCKRKVHVLLQKALFKSPFHMGKKHQIVECMPKGRLLVP